MPWKYSQTSGELKSPAGSTVGTGYSGRGAGLNNAAMQNVPDVGPIPRGDWEIGSFFDDPGGKGPVVCHLTPMALETAQGRSGFMIHGDNEAGNHSASEGCLILTRGLRLMIQASADRVLTVVE